MKNNQSGFAAVIVALIVAVTVLAGAGVWIYKAQIVKPNPVPIGKNNGNQPSQTTEIEKETKTKTAEPEKLPEGENVSVIPADKNVDYSGEYFYLKKYDNGRSESGTLKVRQISPNEINFDFDYWNTQMNGGVIEKGTAKLDNDVAVYEHQEFSDKPCIVKILFKENIAKIEIGSSAVACGFGNGPIIDGDYIKKIGSAPKDFIKFADYIPAGWQIIAKEEGDLNKDGVSDAALVVEDAVEDGVAIDWQYCADRKCGCAQTKNCARKLMLFFGKKGGGYELSLESDKAILLADEGGSFGDPLQKLEINNGSILLNFNGGSYWRWDKIYRFRYQDSGWFLIGKTANDYYSGCYHEIFQSVDVNYLTGKTETITGDGWTAGGNVKEEYECGPYSATQKGTSVWSDVGIKSLVDLKNFDPRIN